LYYAEIERFFVIAYNNGIKVPIIEWTWARKSPLAPLSQRGVNPPFGKGR
jgi:hypothetical protein